MIMVSLLVSRQCFIQTPKHWGRNEDCCGRLPNEARTAENPRPKAESGDGVLGRGQQAPTS